MFDANAQAIREANAVELRTAIITGRRLHVGPREHLGANCPKCGTWVGRSRGNLRERKSWVNAVRAMLARHFRLCHPPEPPADRQA